MMLAPLHRSGRRGAATVELSVVLIVMILFMFGIFEFSRAIFIRQLVDNAVREGARFAVVNTGNDAVQTQQVQDRVTQLLPRGQFSQFPTPLVYRANANGNPDPLDSNWKDAGFGDRIAVVINDAQFTALLPT